ncbi:hypothetical protein F2P81_016097 [Scophthalmus maximus]|uniref:Secreted protein n=1 Tax=Scophthalmus maximus TaxID=52904 RepID=A0A6A4SML7_SCOMX|nr:hypothetical protein F2P81_016097 [Scophthalmus maximus]
MLLLLLLLFAAAGVFRLEYKVGGPSDLAVSAHFPIKAQIKLGVASNRIDCQKREFDKFTQINLITAKWPMFHLCSCQPGAAHKRASTVHVSARIHEKWKHYEHGAHERKGPAAASVNVEITNCPHTTLHCR